jgi:uncharacterized membrane protein
VAHIEREILINAPLEQVFHYVADPVDMMNWLSGLVKNQDVPQGPVEVGQRWTQFVQVMGRKFEYIREVTDYDPPHRVAWRFSALGVDGIGYCDLELAESSTKIVFGLDYTYPRLLLGGLLDKVLMEKLANREAQSSLVRLKELLEDRQGAVAPG